MSSFQRDWGLKINDRITSLPILDFTKTNTTRISFSITVVPDLFLNYGTIKVYNLKEERRSSLHYRSLTKKTIGEGARVSLNAGYSYNSGIIFTGAIHNSYSVQDGVDTVTIMEVGINVGDIDRAIQPANKSSLKTPVQISQAVKNILKKAVTVNGVQKIQFSSKFDIDLQAALAASSIVSLDYALTPNGTISSIIDYFNKKLKIIIYKDGAGKLSVSPANKKSSDPFIDPLAGKVFYTSKNDGFGELIIGSPYDYINGVKFRSFLNPTLKLFQSVSFKSKFIERSGAIISIMHSGDTRTNEWYSDIDMINRKPIE